MAASPNVRACVEETQDLSNVTFYKIVVVCESNSWFVLRRQSEFEALLGKLKAAFGRDDLAQLKLPGGLFATKKKKMIGLNDFIAAVANNPKLLQNDDVREFLNIDKILEKTLINDSIADAANGTAAAVSRPMAYGRGGGRQASSEEDPLYLGKIERRGAKPNDFDYCRSIGKGSFGMVWLACHKKTKEYFAVKVLKKQVVLRRGEVAHIMSERSVLMQNKHPFLVSLHYAFQTKHKLYLVLDFVNGGELFFHLQRERRFSVDRARFYAAEIASALGFLHKLGVVYRDLKPENLLLDKDGNIMLTDFGLCKEGINPDGTMKTFCGTPEYLAPEVLLKKLYGPTVDWWCLGAVTYEMIFGLPPFYERDTKKMYDRILHEPLHVPHTLTPAGRDLLTGLLRKDHRVRLGGNEDFDELRRHPFFSPINWDHLVEKKIKPPFKPMMSGPLDVHNIDPEFTNQPIPASLTGTPGHQICVSVKEPGTDFHGFTYVRPTDIRLDTDG